MIAAVTRRVNEKKLANERLGEQLRSRWIFAMLDGVARCGENLLPDFPREVPVPELLLTAEQEAEAQRLAEIIAQKAKEEALIMARLLVSKKDHELLGATEFQIRDRVHKLGAFALETALQERKKGGTKGRV
jgi:hypothetical protein